jgi:hypothetical protein
LDPSADDVPVNLVVSVDSVDTGGGETLLASCGSSAPLDIGPALVSLMAVDSVNTPCVVDIFVETGSFV